MWLRAEYLLITVKLHSLCSLFLITSLGMFALFVILLNSNRYPQKKKPSPSLIACWTWIFRLDPSPQFADLDLEKSWMSLDLPQSSTRSSGSLARAPTQQSGSLMTWSKFTFCIVFLRCGGLFVTYFIEETMDMSPSIFLSQAAGSATELRILRHIAKAAPAEAGAVCRTTTRRVQTPRPQWRPQVPGIWAHGSECEYYSWGVAAI